MAHARSSAWPGRARILVVYDEHPTRALVVEALAAANDVLETSRVKTALDLLGTSGYGCDAVIVTCLAPHSRPDFVRHVEFIRAMFQRWPWIPVIVVTRAPDVARLTGRLLLTGVREFLLKPVVASRLVAAVARAAPRPGKGLRVPPATIDTIRRVVKFLGERADDVPSLDDLASTAAMSRSHFSHTFHAVVGMPLRDYVRDLRLKHAHELLLISSLPIGAIATEVGFYDQPHFDKTFRLRLGMSPVEYRRQQVGARVSARPVRSQRP